MSAMASCLEVTAVGELPQAAIAFVMIQREQTPTKLPLPER